MHVSGRGGAGRRGRRRRSIVRLTPFTEFKPTPVPLPERSVLLRLAWRASAAFTRAGPERGAEHTSVRQKQEWDTRQSAERARSWACLAVWCTTACGHHQGNDGEGGEDTEGGDVEPGPTARDIPVDHVGQDVEDLERGRAPRPTRSGFSRSAARTPATPRPIWKVPMSWMKCLLYGSNVASASNQDFGATNAQMPCRPKNSPTAPATISGSSHLPADLDAPSTHGHLRHEAPRPSRRSDSDPNRRGRRARPSATPAGRTPGPASMCGRTRAPSAK